MNISGEKAPQIYSEIIVKIYYPATFSSELITDQVRSTREGNRVFPIYSEIIVKIYYPATFSSELITDQVRSTREGNRVFPILVLGLAELDELE